MSKYADHLPLYRQAQIYARQGVNLDRSTLADWVGTCGLPAAAGARAAARPAEGLNEAVRRRDDGTGARSRTRADQDRSALGLCPGRPSVGRHRSARRCLCLCARSQGGAADRPSRRVPRRAAGRRLWRLQGAGRARRGAPRLLLEPCPPPVLRTRPERSGADRVRGADAHRRPLPDRGRHPRPFRPGAPGCPAGAQPPFGRSTPALAARRECSPAPTRALHTAHLIMSL